MPIEFTVDTDAPESTKLEKNLFDILILIYGRWSFCLIVSFDFESIAMCSIWKGFSDSFELF